MELAPPSYSDATRKDHWSLVALYLKFEDLVRACLVCKTWHKAFAPPLWGNPLQHSSLRYEDPWFALRKFEHIVLHVARLEVREMTHTLEVPLDIDSLHVDVGSRWLYNLLSLLPRLQSLSVRGVPYFDQAALLILFGELKSKIPSPEALQFSYYLRLLDASNCINIGEQSISIISQLLPNLVFLDLSGTSGRAIVPAACLAGGLPVKHISALQYLKVLKLNSCKLNDSMVRVLALSIKRRVRSLDVRNNPITNMSVVELLSNCLVKVPSLTVQGQLTPEPSPLSEPPGYKKPEAQPRYDVEGLDDALYLALTTGRVGRITLEDDGEPGITQLKLSLSSISLKTLFKCMGCPNLQYLDVETGSIHFDSTVDYVPSCSNLEYLRVHHSLVTKVSAISKRATGYISSSSNTLNLSRVLAHKRRLAETDQTDFTNLIPNLPKLRNLVLAGIPEFSSDLTLSDRLVTLLRNCGVAASLATLQAHFECSTEVGKRPIKSRFEEKRERTLSPLRKLVFELLPYQSESQIATARGWNLPVSTRAVTEDRDSEAMWDIANNDYSFFDHPEYEGEPDTRLNITNARSQSSSSESFPSSPSNSILRNSNHSSDSVSDIVAAIIAFRKDSRRRYAAALSTGKEYDIVHDYLDATVSLVRHKL